MKVVKCINNNVAICLDDDNNELVAFGKGIGFKKPPFEIDVAVIQKTYYGIDENYVHMINEIPEEILLLSEEIIKYAEYELDYIGCRIKNGLVKKRDLQTMVQCHRE